jgi:6,7-dimethyl-8-ribityllumazine synthase
MPHLLVLEARYYTEINDNMLSGIDKVMKDAQATYDVMAVPGSYELPAALNFALQSEKYDAFVLIGCVIRGATSHYDHICDSVFQTVQDLAVRYDLALGQGILTCEDYDQAFERADPTNMNYGGKAAKAALAMYDLKQKLVK